MRPCSVDDVRVLVMDVPEEFLRGLSGIYLLGGTKRQRRLRQATYGMYTLNRIFLSALPDPMLRQVWRPPPKPSVAKRYTRLRSEVHEAGRW